ncbi:MAG: hypothetical protein HY906_12100 [Deltaproteobacteria bacterium]|nr:hypothetical protein [Deltaproteobacteria bacterium]
MARALVAILAAALALLDGCSSLPSFQCSSSGVCMHGGVQGICEASGYCSFPDTACPPPGRRYGEWAGHGLAGRCVAGLPDGGPDAPADGPDGGPDAPADGPGPAEDAARDTGTGDVAPDGEVDACGETGHACCDGGACTAGAALCLGGTCQEGCGQVLDPCCAGDLCDAHLTCWQESCHDECGDVGQECCGNVKCRPGLHCLAASCS